MDLPEGMAMYKVRFQMVGFVEVPAHDEEEAREQAIHNAILPGLSHYDVQQAEVTKVEVIGKCQTPSGQQKQPSPKRR